ncbi:MAG: glycosyltransferase family 4 protein [Rhodothermaceae bacterium]|nr:glycosyltransferase family 4 protein [Rhodothermaceae bacterium]
MRVLLNAPAPENHGGVANYCKALLPHFRADVEVMHRGSRAGETGVAARAKRLAQDTARLVQTLKHGRFDVVHQNTSFYGPGIARDAILANRAKASGAKLFIRLHGWDHAFEPTFNSRRFAWIKQQYFNADAIAVDADEYEQKIRAWGYTGRMFRETTVVDDELLGQRPEGEPSHPLTVLFLARLAEDKGVIEALEATRLVQEKHPDLHIVVAGEGPVKARAEAWVAERGMPNVSFPGYVRDADKAAVFASSDLYLLPTLHGEGLPTSILEAMAFGLPIITRPMGGIPDHLRDGENGFLTERTDPETFAGFVTRLVEDDTLRKAQGERNQTVARERYLASTVAARLESAYATLAETN